MDWEYNSTEKELEEIILAKGPHMPEVAPKYLNTLEFLYRDKGEDNKIPVALAHGGVEKAIFS